MHLRTMPFASDRRECKPLCIFQNNPTCVTGAGGEALEAELNKTGPGSCKYVICDVSKEEDIKVKVQLYCYCSGYTGLNWLLFIFFACLKAALCLLCCCLLCWVKCASCFVGNWFFWPASCSNATGVTVLPQRLIAVTAEHYGHIDCLVNNAGWRESHTNFPLQQMWWWGCL